MKIRPLLFIVFFALAACVPLADALIEPGGVLYQESFPDPGTGWLQASTPAGIQGYDRGGYRFLVQAADRSLIAAAGLTLSDVRVEVDSAMLGGPVENRIGLICRMQDPSHFYFFLISSDGYYALGKVKEDRLELIGQERWLQSAAIQQGVALNHLRADCVGSQLTFYVNDVAVAVGEDSDYPRGDVGLLAGSFAAPGVDAFFDNFVVYKP